ncbi:neurosecretory protein VGF [Rhineura floridana]|uniref:neurosecretory protein VGF n=1 Tax=Rhineura floridana TaxID=261503 RepID=UPI002AC87378|nr:neurosecretory protein VGF [Rhineura floridana]
MEGRIEQGGSGEPLHPRGRMLRPQSLHRAACLLSLCLLVQCHLPAADAVPLSLEEEEAHPGNTFLKAENMPASSIRVHSLPGTSPGAEDQNDSHEGDLFQDVDPKALAAILLQALQIQPSKPSERHLNPEPSANEEQVPSETMSSDVQQPEKEEGWKASKDGGQPEEEEEEKEAKAEERNFGQQELETLKSMLEELQQYSSTTKREVSSQGYQAAGPESPRNDVLKELEEYEQLKVNTKRKAPPSEPWAGARKLRQQQHLEHQLLQRRYEELAESRKQAEEARRAAAEEERLADMASDLLLQYLLKDGEEGEEEQQGANAQERSEEEEGAKGSSLLFEDEEGNVAEDKRSNEAPEEEEEGGEDDIDPNTIDRLIELSSKLHLPADDVIDIINNVEKKKEEVPEPSTTTTKGKLSVAAPWNKPPKSPSYGPYYQDTWPAPNPYYPPAYKPYHHLPKQNEAAWNEVLKGDEYPAPKWYRARPSGRSTTTNKISNYIKPWTFQPPAHHRYHPLPGPIVPRDEYYDDSEAHDEELENYIESVLMKHPKVFQ